MSKLKQLESFVSVVTRGSLTAAAIAEGDDNWKQFATYGLASTHRPFGYAGAQAAYWWQQGQDWLKSRLEG